MPTRCGWLAGCAVLFGASTHGHHPPIIGAFQHAKKRVTAEAADRAHVLRVTADVGKGVCRGRVQRASKQEIMATGATILVPSRRAFQAPPWETTFLAPWWPQRVCQPSQSVNNPLINPVVCGAGSSTFAPTSTLTALSQPAHTATATAPAIALAPLALSRGYLPCACHVSAFALHGTRALVDGQQHECHCQCSSDCEAAVHAVDGSGGVARH
jgi:hypothetical protein